MNIQATLLINRSDSKCFNCDKGARPSDKSHDEAIGWDGREPGCGIVWQYVSSEYGDMVEDVRDMRPDLTYIEPAVLWPRS
jgi:hypothetical protein